MDEDDLARFLKTHRRFSLKEIQTLLRECKGVHYSLKQLSIACTKVNIYHRKKMNTVEENEAKDTIKILMKTAPSTAGYRTIWSRLKSEFEINISRNQVMKLMREVDAPGVIQRKKGCIKRREYSVPGPNYQWHIDGWDKLKQYGISVHGCIDGYSRKVIWLEVGPTNKNPRVVAKYFTNSIKEIMGLPTIIRADAGTENVMIEHIQKSLRSTTPCFIYGSSVRNSRIERFWGSFRRMCAQHLMTMFSELESQGILCTSDQRHIAAVRYCFLPIIRRTVSEFHTAWNEHTVRGAGKPLMLYTTGVNHAEAVTEQIIKLAEPYIEDVDDVEGEFAAAADTLLANEEEPETSDDAALYLHCKSKFLKLLSYIK